MPTDRDPLHLDERTARLGQELFAKVRQEQQDEQATEKEQSWRRQEDSGDGSLWDALFGESVSGDDGGDGD